MAVVRLLRSAGVRLALGYALMFGVSALLLIFALWWSTLNLLNGQVDAAINADAQGLREQWNENGLPGLVATINKRIAGNVDNDALYLVLDPLGRRIAGNLMILAAKASSRRTRITRCRRIAAPASGSGPVACCTTLPDG